MSGGAVEIRVTANINDARKKIKAVKRDLMSYQNLLHSIGGTEIGGAGTFGELENAIDNARKKLDGLAKSYVQYNEHEGDIQKVVNKMERAAKAYEYTNKRLQTFLGQRKQIQSIVSDMDMFGEAIKKMDASELDLFKNMKTGQLKEAERLLDDLGIQAKNAFLNDAPVQDFLHIKNDIEHVTKQVDILSKQLKKLGSTALGKMNVDSNGVAESWRNLRSEVGKVGSSLKKVSGGGVKDISKGLQNTLGTLQGVRQGFGGLVNSIGMMSREIGKMSGKKGMGGLQSAVMGVGKGFNGVLASIGKMVALTGNMVGFTLAFAGISLVMNGVTQAMEFSTVATTNFQAAGAALSASLVPALEAVSYWARDAMVWIAGLINFLFGFNILEKAIDGLNHKLARTGTNAQNAANKVKGSLAGFDEINNVNTGNAISGGIQFPSVDIQNTLNAIEELQKMLEEMNNIDFSWAEGIKTFVQWGIENFPILAGVFTGLAIAIGLVGAAVKIAAFFAGILSLPFLIAIVVISALIGWIVYLVMKHGSLEEAWTAWVDTCTTKGRELDQWFSDKYGPSIDEAGENTKGFFQDIDDELGKFNVKWAEFEETIKRHVDKALAWIGEKWDGFWIWVNGKLEEFNRNVDEFCAELRLFFDDPLGYLLGVWMGFWDRVEARFEPLLTKLRAVSREVGLFFDDPSQYISRSMTKFLGWWDDFWVEAIVWAVAAAGNMIVNKIIHALNVVIGAINSLITKLNRLPFIEIGLIGKIEEWGSGDGFQSNMENPWDKFDDYASYDIGTNSVPRDMTARIHEGEAIIPKRFNKSEFFAEMGGGSDDRVVGLLEYLIEVVEEKNMHLSIDGKVIGQTAVNYINRQTRVRGVSVLNG